MSLSNTDTQTLSIRIGEIRTEKEHENMQYQHFDFIKQCLGRAQCPCIRKRDNDTLLINSHMKMMIVCRMRTRTNQNDDDNDSATTTTHQRILLF